MALTEFSYTALILGIFGILVGSAVLLSRTLERVGVPVALLFLVLGMLAGSEAVGRLAFEDYRFAFRVGTLALVLILFDGGLNTSVASIRESVRPATVLATLGVGITAILVAVAAWLAGLSWIGALLLGAIVSSTDAATVFAVLRGSGLHLRRRVGTTLELESGLNDPMAVILTVTMTQVALTGEWPGWMILATVPLQLVIGGAVGVAFGFLGREVVRRVRLSAGGLYPALTLSVALLAFGGATLLQGSGFLAVYAAGVVLGNTTIPYRNGLARVHDALAWLSQIGMFLMLGLLVFPSQLVPWIWVGLGLGLFMAFVARPIAVGLCLLPFGFPMKELGYIGWVGLRGAVPIILATYPVLMGVERAGDLFNLVFFVVVINALVPGTTIGFVTRRLGLQRPTMPTPAAALEINSTKLLSGDILSFHIGPSVLVAGATISELPFPEGSSVILIVRGETLLAAKGGTVIQPGDFVYVFCRTEERGLVELLFGRPQEETEA